uniref:Uncharacterized protein n=2 Tax=Lutzomyia longipalpis TaxID=7200 RepID=A0A1B0CJ18_LUTLO
MWMTGVCYFHRNNGDLETELIESSCPILPSSVATLIGQMAMCRTKDAIAEMDAEVLNHLQQQVDNFEEMLRESGDFGNLMSILAQVVQSGENDSVVGLSADKRAVIEKSLGESAEAHRANGNEKVAHLYADQEKKPRDIGTLWSWVYQFAQCTSDDSGNNKSFNFISSPTDLVAFNENSTQPPEVESPLATEIDAKLTDDGGDLLPGHPPTVDANEKAPIDTPSNIDDDVIDVGAFLREAESKGLFQVGDTPSIITFLSRGDAPHAADPELSALKDYLEQCTDTFQDINELLSGFTAHQNSHQAGSEMVEKIVTRAAQMATMSREDSSIDDKANTSDEEKMTQDDPNIINVFAKSGIEADEDLIRAAIAEQMILGLIEKTIRDSEDTLRVIEGEQSVADAPQDAEPHDVGGSANQESRENSTESEGKIQASADTESFAGNTDREQVGTSVDNDSSTQGSRESQAAQHGDVAHAVGEIPSQEATQSVDDVKSETIGENSSGEKDASQGEPVGIEKSLDMDVGDGVVKEENQVVASPENDSIEKVDVVGVENDGVNKLESSSSVDMAIEADTTGGESETKNDQKVSVLDSSGENESSARVSIEVKPEESPHGVNATESQADSNSAPLVSKSDSKDDEGEKVYDKSLELLEPVESQSNGYEKSSSADGRGKHTSYSCTVGPILGIGAAVSHGTLTALMDYLTERAKEQNGMIYPRNFDEEQCPPLYDDVK